jgi:spore maturation protein CgeB
MKLVIFGLSVSSSWGNGHATLWRGLCRSLAGRGHSVVFFERDAPWYSSSRDLTELPGGGELIFYSDWSDIAAKARLHLADADVGMVTSYCPDALPASSLLLESGAGVKAFYDLDSPITLARLRNGENVDYVGPRGFRDFDLVLSYAGGRTLTDLEQVLGARRVAPLYGSVDPLVHKPTDPDPEFTADLSYLGTHSADRAEALKRLLLEPARRLPRRKFIIGGSMYDGDFPWLPNIYWVSHLAPARHPAFYCSAKVTLNATRGPMAQSGYCPSGRLFEAAACGVPVFTDSWEGIETFYEPGSQILVGRTAEDAVEMLNRSPGDLARIGRAARERTLADHTADRRVKDLEQILETACRNLPVLEGA